MLSSAHCSTGNLRKERVSLESVEEHAEELSSIIFQNIHSRCGGLPIFKCGSRFRLASGPTEPLVIGRIVTSNERLKLVSESGVQLLVASNHAWP